jgi:hypothetical protein
LTTGYDYLVLQEGAGYPDVYSTGTWFMSEIQLST